MGSLRNPVGPLPSSIYWRRRAVGLSVLALLVVLVLWAVLSGGGDGDKSGKGKGGPSPAASITPGPSGTGPVVPGEPGGRDEPGGSGGDGADNGSTGGGSTDSGGADGSAAGAGSAGAGGGSGGSGGAGGAGGGGGAGGAGQQVPANSPLVTCAPASVELTVRTVQNDVDVDKKAKFEVVAKNLSAADCKLDFGPAAAVVNVKNTDGDTVWSSKDCPEGARSLMLRVPAKTTVTHPVEWDRTRSDAKKCEAPAGGSVPPGTYVVELVGAKVPASVYLKKD
ncbi:hypothetical protein ACFYVL_27265 [Streptomyces sp. NPDC004111]|uniref:hypothetical protein n=1 Tax=Streptomyces sp. NPDC004111 TaxID=3364690 RepID=UPI0036862F7A